MLNRKIRNAENAENAKEVNTEEEKKGKKKYIVLLALLLMLGSVSIDQLYHNSGNIGTEDGGVVIADDGTPLSEMPEGLNSNTDSVSNTDASDTVYKTTSENTVMHLNTSGTGRPSGSIINAVSSVLNVIENTDGGNGNSEAVAGGNAENTGITDISEDSVPSAEAPVIDETTNISDAEVPMASTPSDGTVGSNTNNGGNIVSRPSGNGSSSSNSSSVSSGNTGSSDTGSNTGAADNNTNSGITSDGTGTDSATEGTGTTGNPDSSTNAGSTEETTTGGSITTEPEAPAQTSISGIELLAKLAAGESVDMVNLDEEQIATVNEGIEKINTYMSQNEGNEGQSLDSEGNNYGQFITNALRVLMGTDEGFSWKIEYTADGYKIYYWTQPIGQQTIGNLIEGVQNITVSNGNASSVVNDLSAVVTEKTYDGQKLTTFDTVELNNIFEVFTYLKNTNETFRGYTSAELDSKGQKGSLVDTALREFAAQYNITLPNNFGIWKVTQSGGKITGIYWTSEFTPEITASLELNNTPEITAYKCDASGIITEGTMKAAIGKSNNQPIHKLETGSFSDQTLQQLMEQMNSLFDVTADEDLMLSYEEFETADGKNDEADDEQISEDEKSEENKGSEDAAKSDTDVSGAVADVENTADDTLIPEISDDLNNTEPSKDEDVITDTVTDETSTIESGAEKETETITETEEY